jgi:hypothetical protein
MGARPSFGAGEQYLRSEGRVSDASPSNKKQGDTGGGPAFQIVLLCGRTIMLGSRPAMA